MSFREFAAKNIFEPLEMKSTFFRDDHAEIVKNNAYGYEPRGETFRLSLTNFDTVGATSLHTTVEDLALWDENFYHARVGGPSLPEQMLHRAKLNNREVLDYAFGLVLGKYRGLDTVDHAGGDAGYRSDMTRFPEQHFSAAMLCNSADTNPTSLVHKVADIYLAKQLKDQEKPAGGPSAIQAPGTPLTAQQLSDLAGLYWKSDGDEFLKIYVKDQKLRISFDLGNDFSLKSVSGTFFHIANVPWGDQVNIRFQPSEGNGVRRLLSSFGDEKPDIFECVTTFTPDRAEFGEYARNYASEEIEPIYRVIVQDGKLVLNRLKHKVEILEPRTRDVFSGEVGTIRFTRDSKHQITGFLLSTGPIRNFRFTRQAN